ncbi:MAG: alpha/beta hydrolase [Chitinophagales bacterium]
MQFQVRTEGEFQYVEEGEGEVILLLHGLFGALSNFADTINHFKDRYKVVIPILPLYRLPLDQTSVTGMVDHIDQFIAHKNYNQLNLIGNSLGGHIGIVYTLRRQEKVRSLTLTASSGLFESSLGDQYPKKSDYEYIRKKTAETFYNPALADKELVDEVYEIVNNREKAIRIVFLAKSAVRHNMREEIEHIQVPCNLIWGANDTITPPFVGEEFKKLLKNSELHILNECCHAPMMEQPAAFNTIMDNFLERILSK